jgi:predicted small metal-binding protein
MSKTLDFKDIGLDCDLVLCAPTEEAVIEKAGEHIQAVHGMKGFSKEFFEKARRAIHDAECNSEEEPS